MSAVFGNNDKKTWLSRKLSILESQIWESFLIWYGSSENILGSLRSENRQELNGLSGACRYSCGVWNSIFALTHGVNLCLMVVTSRASLISALLQFTPFKIPSFMFVLRVITAECVMLRCKVWRTNLFKIVDLFATPIFIALWQR